MYKYFASIILDISIDKTLDYGIPENMESLIRPGVRVEVPVRGKAVSGYVFSVKTTSEYPLAKPISKVCSSGEVITEDLFKLAVWMAKYYCAPFRQVFKMMLPAGIRQSMKHKEQLYVMRGKTKEQLSAYCIEIRNKYPAQAAIIDAMLQVKKGILLSELLEQTKGSRSSVDSLAKKGILILDIIRIDRSPLINEEYFQTKPKALNSEQAEAFAKILASIKRGSYETHLLYGITGSGKTEVYLQAIDEALAMGKGSLMLVPEISLTAQTIERFRCRFNEKIAILHHRLSPGEKNDEWHKIRTGEAKIVIGARSAIFSPIQNIGLIIIDEEHEQSYKQNDEPPCYQARDVAVMRGKLASATVILGSATPSIESYYNALSGKYTLSILSKRPSDACLPKVTLVDMRKEFEKAKGFTNFSDALISGIKKRHELGEKTILFLNRRGYHTTLQCLPCGKGIQCKHCDVSMTFHKGDNCLSCHLCGFTHTPPPTVCPECNSPHPLKFRGVGTEQVEKALHAVLPGIRTLRIDADTTKHKGSHQKLLRDFGSGKADVLIGTQMIAKGLHFPDVTLVGVLNCDAGLNIPDFRASETTFQLITQVAGRAGRGALPGEVIIQTSLVENSTIQLASRQNYLGFYNEEIAIREMFCYPPFSQLAKLTFYGTDAKRAETAANCVREELQKGLSKEFELHPVAPCGYARIKDLHRFQFLIRGPSMTPLNGALEKIELEKLVPKSVKIRVDINPASTFF